ncbi:flagellar basal body P-ring protein FlgI [soil metagenome]
MNARMLAAGFATLGLAAFTGCVGLGGKTDSKDTVRPQASEDPAATQQIAKVGDKTAVGNVDPQAVSAVGLVWKLNGTGSIAGGEWRALLERDLRKKKLPNTKQYLDDPNKSTSLVLVSAVIPPGAKKGDTIDVDVSLPRGSGTTSLKGGVLLECDLATTEESGAVREAMAKNGASVGASPVMGNTLLIGKTLVRAEGPLVVGTTETAGKVKVKIEGEVEDNYTVGRVWGGGRVLEDRPYYFVINDKNARLAMEIAERVNATFQPHGDTRNKVASAVSGTVVSINVPAAYRLNHTRFLTVARQVPLQPVQADSLYRKQLEQELLEPSTAVTAAVKLEALGGESQQPLRVGLQSPSPWVRFASAEALAYLGNTAAAGELAKLAEQNPALRTHCLVALATLDDGVSCDRLVELMSHPEPQVRYGAFTALRSANERHTALNGKHVKKTFWVHQVAPESAPMVHLASAKRAEIILFGKVNELLPPFSFPLGKEFTVTAKIGDLQATVTRIINGTDGAQDVSVKSSLSLASLLNAVGEMGGGYSEAVELVRRADGAKVLAANVLVDAIPQGIPLVQLAQLARSEANLDRANLEVDRICRLDGLPASFDLPLFDEVKQVSNVEPVILNRNPGRLFAGKKHPMDDDAETFEPKPATAPPPASESSLSRNQGRLFSKKSSD